MEWQTPHTGRETKLNYGPDRNPNAPCPISPKKLGMQWDSGLLKDPQCVVVMMEKDFKTNASLIGRISGCLGPTWELQDIMPLLYRSTPTKHSSLVVMMKILMT